MIEFLAIAISGAVGALLGVLFFGGLWWTVKLGLTSPWAALWFSMSLLVRTVVVIAGIYFVAHGELIRLGASLAGFVIARHFVVKRCSQALAGLPIRIEKEARVAP